MSDRLHITVRPVDGDPRYTVDMQLPTTGDGSLPEPWPTMLDAAARIGCEVTVSRLISTRERWELRKP